jgi:hypothetical protein
MMLGATRGAPPPPHPRLARTHPEYATSIIVVCLEADQAGFLDKAFSTNANSSLVTFLMRVSISIW